MKGGGKELENTENRKIVQVSEYMPGMCETESFTPNTIQFPSHPHPQLSHVP